MEGATYDYETSLLINDKVHYVIVSIKIVKYDGKECALSAIQDITESKLAQHAKELSEQTLSEAMDLAKLGHWEYNYSIEQVYFLTIRFTECFEHRSMK